MYLQQRDVDAFYGVSHESLCTIQPGDCVVIIFPDGQRQVARVELAQTGEIVCWGHRFQAPGFAYTDKMTGENYRLAVATDAECRELWRRIARSRLLSYDWQRSNELTDDQLSRIVAILDECVPTGDGGD